MKQQLQVAAAHAVRNSVDQVIGFRVTLVPSGETPADEPLLFGGRMEIYATDPRAERVFAAGRQFVLDLSTADDEPLVPPAEIPAAADAAADGRAANTPPGEASPASADPPAEDLPAAA
ncbi:hypothetical protein [Planctellipticum variicoloris]|uniref:hypothetical protein n=1 Tax=Planctellipticum variicoloris TaxID=3064265 RepID=UPI0030141A6E|nr:hypothetical protein SH412_002689 [Planctomycetaceae bacterium SH412]